MTSPIRHPLDPLVDVMAKLRSPEGCPWDREQDHHTLRRYLIEEAYEAIDAIDEGDDAHLIEELGDVLLQIVFHSQIAREEGRFGIDDVVAAVTDKMIERHPHVFGDAHAPDAETVLANWDRMKREKKARTKGSDEHTSIMDGMPSGLPALMLAHEAQKRASRVGFDWPHADGAVRKVAEEAREIAALASGDAEHLAQEWGDLLFSLVNVARHLRIDSESALRDATHKFIRRFRHIERAAEATGRGLDGMTLEEMDALWDEAKAQEQSEGALGIKKDRTRP